MFYSIYKWFWIWNRDILTGIICKCYFWIVIWLWNVIIVQLREPPWKTEHLPLPESFYPEQHLALLLHTYFRVQGPVWIRSNLYIVRTASCTHRWGDGVGGRVSEGLQPDRMQLCCLFLSERLHVILMSPDLFLCHTWSHSWDSSNGGSAHAALIGVRRSSDIRRLDDDIVFFYFSRSCACERRGLVKCLGVRGARRERNREREEGKWHFI